MSYKPVRRGRLDQEELCIIAREVLESHRTALVANLDPEPHFPILKSRNVITASECEEISRIPSKRGRAEKLIEILLTRGNNGYLALAQSMLEEKTQMFLLKQLNKSFEMVRRKRESNLIAISRDRVISSGPFSLQSMAQPESMNY